MLDKEKMEMNTWRRGPEPITKASNVSFHRILAARWELEVTVTSNPKNAIGDVMLWWHLSRLWLVDIRSAFPLFRWLVIGQTHFLGLGSQIAILRTPTYGSRHITVLSEQLPVLSISDHSIREVLPRYLSKILTPLGLAPFGRRPSLRIYVQSKHNVVNSAWVQLWRENRIWSVQACTYVHSGWVKFHQTITTKVRDNPKAANGSLQLWQCQGYRQRHLDQQSTNIGTVPL